MHKLSVVTIHFKCTEVLQRLLDSAETLGALPQVEWIIIDHSPAQPSLPERLKLPRNFEGVRILEYPQNKGFGDGCNLGARNSDGEVLLFLNPDCRFRGGSLPAFADRLLREETTAALSPLLVTTHGQPEFSFDRFPGLLNEARLKSERILSNKSAIVRKAIRRRFEKTKWVDWATGGALFVRRDAFSKVGGFDDGYFLYFEDSDFCKRLHKAGYKVGFDPSFTLIHDHGHGGSDKVPSGKSNVYRTSQLRYYRKHKNPLARALLEGYLRVSGRYPQ
jgi:GT2 family glycosyltransferase